MLALTVGVHRKVKFLVIWDIKLLIL